MVRYNVVAPARFTTRTQLTQSEKKLYATNSNCDSGNRILSDRYEAPDFDCRVSAGDGPWFASR